MNGSPRWCAALLCMASPAWAQVPVTIQADQVVVTPIQPMTPGIESEAARLDAILKQALEGAYELVPFESIEGFDEYVSATDYLMSCPGGQYSGCQLVLAQRADADWSIGGTLVPVGEDLGAGDQLELNVVVVDVHGSREVMAFGVVVGGGTDDQAVLSGVAGVFAQVLNGLAQEVDVRGEMDDPAAARDFEKRRETLIANSLARLESEQGVMVREEAVRELDAEKVRSKDFDDFDQREDAAPWERLDMSKFQYVHFQNLDISVQDFRWRMRGRLAQILLRVNFGGGPGPWGMHHEGRWLVGTSGTSGFQNIEVHQYQEVRRSGSSTVQFELGFGLAPFLEASFAYGLRNAQFSFRFDQDVDGEPSLVDNPSISTGRTTQIGGRLLFAPLPTYQVRPTLSAGFFAWNGSNIVPSQDPLITLGSPSSTFIEVAPGAEISAGRHLNLFARVPIEIPLDGTYIDQYQTGVAGSLQNFDEPVGDYSGGYTILVGFQARINLLKPPPDGSRPTGIQDGFEDEEPDL